MARNKIRRVDFWPDEFLAGVSNLDYAEVGPYWIACCLMYSRGGPIDDDDKFIAKAIGCHWRTWRTIKLRLLALGKLHLSDGKLTNARAMAEMGKASGRVDDAHAAAAQSVRARAERRAAKSTPSGTVQDAVRNGSGSVQDGVTIDSQSVQDGPQPNDYNEIPEAPASSRARANHQPPTTNQKKEITKTSFCGEVSREATPLNPPPPRPSNASVLPEGWEPKPDLASWAETKLADEAPGLSVGGEVERFRNHYRGKAGRTTSNDWSATFKNWIGDSISRSKTNGQRPHHDYQKPSGKLGAGAERYILAEYARSGGPESADEQRRSAKPIVVGSASLADDAPATEKRNRKAR